jgi:glycosyltransferase involved in cell wall biosynthesis
MSSRIFIDCSLAGTPGEATGISRVVRQLVTASIDTRFGSRPVVSVAARDGTYRSHSGRFDSSPTRSGAAAAARAFLRKGDEWLRVHFPSVEHAVVKAVMAAGGIPSLGLATAGAAAAAQPVRFQSGDGLLLADATWMIPRWQPAVESAKAQGAHIVPLIHDLLPWSHPQFFAPLFCAQFTRWLRDVIPLSDALICNSHATADALRQFTTAGGLADALPPVGVFPLGTELTPATLEPRAEVAIVFAKADRPFLMVGTIEPRKNHALVLDAFERFWAAGGTTPLVVIGRRGWQCEATLRRFTALAAAGRPFTHIGDATDADLQYAYRHARCLIFPSVAEGFGLPIVEALAQGLPAIASDIPVHREVAGDLATYIPLGDPAHLAGLLRSIEDGSTLLTAPAPGTVHLPTWAESAAALQSEIDRLLATR